MENPYKKHRDALRTWNEFVKVSRTRGFTDTAIANKLRENNVDEEAILLIMNPLPNAQKRAALAKPGKWKLALGVMKLVLGAASFVVYAAGGPGLIPGILFVVTGLMWLASYSNQE